MQILIRCLLVFIGKTVEVTFTSVKLILLTRQKRLLSALCAFIETLLWALIVSDVIQDLKTSWPILLSYCLGNAAGYFIGSLVEEKIALGTTSVQIISAYSNREKITKILDSFGFGYTISVTEGSKEVNCNYTVIIKRRMVEKLISTLKEKVPDCFVTTADVIKSVGGH